MNDGNVTSQRSISREGAARRLKWDKRVLSGVRTGYFLSTLCDCTHAKGENLKCQMKADNLRIWSGKLLSYSYVFDAIFYFINWVAWQHLARHQDCIWFWPIPNCYLASRLVQPTAIIQFKTKFAPFQSYINLPASWHQQIAACAPSPDLQGLPSSPNLVRSPPKAASPSSLPGPAVPWPVYNP